MIAILIIVVICAFGFFYPKSKLVSYSMLLYMWVFYGFNTYSGDYISYEFVYNSMNKGVLLSHFEPAFSLLMLVSNKVGLSFLGFRILLASIFVILLKIVIDRYSSNTALVLSMFMIFPFMYFASVLRAGISGLIAVYCIKYLYSGERKSTLKYVLGIIVACLFHTSSLFFFVFLLAKRKMSNSGILKIAVLAIVAAIGYRAGILYKLISLVINNTKTLQWLVSEQMVSKLNWKGKLFEVVILFSFVTMTWWSQRIFSRNEKYLNNEYLLKNNDKVNFQNIVYTCNCYLLLLIPFMMISDVWMRLLWEILLINICFWANTSELVSFINAKGRRHKQKTTVSMICIAMLFLEILLSVYMGLPFRGTENAGINMFYNNLIFQYFPM